MTLLPNSNSNNTKSKGSYYFISIPLNNINKSDARKKCYYHATAKREILPLIGVAVLAIVGRYSYRAVMRMQEEWEEYEEDLREYHGTNKPTGTTQPRTDSRHSNPTVNQTLLPILGISIGPSYTRLSFLKSKDNRTTTNDTPLVIENREGSRRTPSFVLFENGSSSYSWGQMAKSKRYQNQESIVSPISELVSLNTASTGRNTNVSTRVAHAQQACLILTREVALNALQKALGGSNTTQQILFGEMYYNIQPVVTYPPSFDFSNSNAKNLFMSSLDSLAADDKTIQYVSEPIAAIAAANHFSLFPRGSITTNDQQPILVLDVGSDGLNVSLVSSNQQDQQQKVLFHSFAPAIGVDTLITAIVDVCVHDFFKSYDAVDGMALQLLYNAAEDVLWELSSSSTNTRNRRAQISIPYLSMDFQTRKPLHLSMGITPHLVEEEATRIILTKNRNNNGTTATTTATITEVISSILMDAFEKTKTTPFQIGAILLCGDGARSPIYQSHIKKGLASIAGEHCVSTKLIIPPHEEAEELVVIGAALTGRGNLNIQ